MKKIHIVFVLAVLMVSQACGLGSWTKYKIAFVIDAKDAEDRTKAIEVIRERLVLLGADKDELSYVDDSHISLVEIAGDGIPPQEIEMILSYSGRESFLVPVDDEGMLKFILPDSLLSAIIVREGGLYLAKAEDTATINKKFRAYATATGQSAKRLLWTEKPNQFIEESVGAYHEVYLADRATSKIPLSAQSVAEAYITADGSGRLAIGIRLHEAWVDDWAAMTRNQVGKKVAIVFDGKVLSAPKVVSEITGGNLIISGEFKRAELERIRVAVSSAPLPAGTTLQVKVGYP